MNGPLVDFLPAEYRRRRAELRTRRERLLLLVPIALAVLATDHVLRQRVRIVQQMAQQANDHAEQGECRRDQVRQLAQRVAAAEAELGDWLEPLRAPRMTQVLDALLADRPDGVTLHELTCRHAPWSAVPTPVMRVHASASSAGAFTAFLEHLQQEPSLPPLTCQRTFHGDREGTIAFHLESSTPAGASR